MPKKDKTIKVYLRGGCVEVHNPTNEKVELYDFDVEGSTKEDIENYAQYFEDEDGEFAALTTW